MFGFLFKKKQSGSFWIYAGEFVLVFLGILIALQVENWNQDRQDRKLERILLSEMRSNLMATLADIEYNIMIQERYLNSTQVAIDFLKSELPWHDSLGYFFTRIMAGTVFDHNNSAYKSLNSIGIDLLRNDSLRQQVSLVYEVRYPKVDITQDLLFTHIYDHLYPAIRTNLHTVAYKEHTIPVDLEELRQNNGFAEDLYMTIFMYNLSIRTYERALEETSNLIADIEEELGIYPGDSL
jgi:hypothetical protein